MEINKPAVKSVGERLRSGFGWGAMAAFGWRALTAASSIIVARILGPTGFGELGILRSTANLFVIYAGFRLGTTATKHLAEFRESNPGRAGRILRMALAISAVFCALSAAILILGSGYIARTMLNNPDLALGLQIAGIFLFFQAYSSVRESILIGTENFKFFARINLIKGGLTATLIVPGAWFWGATGAIAALAFAAFLSYLALQHYVGKALRDFEISEKVPFRVWKVELPLLWTFALPGLLAGAIAVTTLWWGRVVLTGTENGYAELGLFEAANQWRTMILFVPGILTQISLPILAETFGRDRESDFLQAVAFQFRAILLITLPLTVVVICFSEWLMLIFGEAYTASGPILPLLMGSVFLFALNQALRKVQHGAGRLWQNFQIQVAWALVFAVIVLGSGADFNAVSLAWAFFSAEIVMMVVQLLYVEIVLARGILLKVASELAVSTGAIGLAIASLAYFETGSHFQQLLLVAAFGLSLVPSISVGYRYLRRGASSSLQGL